MLNKKSSLDSSLLTFIPIFVFVVGGCSTKLTYTPNGQTPTAPGTSSTSPTFSFSFQTSPNPSPSPSPSASPSPALGTSLAPLSAGASYYIPFIAKNMPAGTTYKMVVVPTGITLASSSATQFSDSIANNTVVAYTAPSQFGSYSMNFTAYSPAGTVIAQSAFPFNVQCSNPHADFNVATLSGIQISTSSGMIAPNQITYQIQASDHSAGIANQLPVGSRSTSGYSCQLDPQGIGIVDTLPQDCTQPFYAFANYLGPRNIGLIVTDLGCNNSVALQVATNTAPNTGSPPAIEVPIVDSAGVTALQSVQGQTNAIVYAELRSAATNPVPNDPSLYNVNYFVFNGAAAPPHFPNSVTDVQAAYNMQNASPPAPTTTLVTVSVQVPTSCPTGTPVGTVCTTASPSPSPSPIPPVNPANFVISSFHQYPMPSSQSFGMNITLTGITDNFPRSTLSSVSVNVTGVVACPIGTSEGTVCTGPSPSPSPILPWYSPQINVSPSTTKISVSYSTDQASNASSLSSQSLSFPAQSTPVGPNGGCVLDSISATPIPFTPGSCEGSGGSTPPFSVSTQVEIWGQFHCDAPYSCTPTTPCNGINGVYIQNGFFDGSISAGDPCPAPGPPGGVTLPSF